MPFETIPTGGRKGPEKSDETSCQAAPTPFEVVADQVFDRFSRLWKLGTLVVNRAYLRNQIMPWFRGRPIADITRAEVQQWFASLYRTPAAADRSLPILSLILRQAETAGKRPEGSNPCTGVNRYRRRGRERFLTPRETARLGEALAAKEEADPLPVAVVRLLLLTGCRQSEIRTLQWNEYREGNLYLRDSKTGPRTVWLSSTARLELDRLPRTHSWVFPAPKRRGPMSSDSLYRFWKSIRTIVGMPDVRLHDLRHTYASVALQEGEAVSTIARLLGHRDSATTLKYMHFADPTAREAVEAVGSKLSD